MATMDGPPDAKAQNALSSIPTPVIMDILSYVGEGCTPTLSHTLITKETQMRYWKVKTVAEMVLRNKRHSVQSALNHAARRGKLAVCRYYLEKHRPAAKADHSHSAALYQAAKGGHLDVCQLLLAQRENPARADTFGSAALQAAAEEGHVDICELFLTHPTHPAKANDANCGALRAAAANGHVDVCRLLLTFPLHPAMADADDSAALEAAAAPGHVEVCRLLLTFPGSPAEPSITTLRHAIRGNSGSVCRLLLEHPEVLEGLGYYNAEEVACSIASQGWIDCLNALLARMTDPEARKVACQRALYAAAEGGQLDMCHWLLCLLKPTSGEQYRYLCSQLCANAAAAGKHELYRVFSDKLKEHDISNACFQTLQQSAEKGNLSQVQRLLRHLYGHDIGERVRACTDLVVRAAGSGEKSMCVWLIQELKSGSRLLVDFFKSKIPDAQHYEKYKRDADRYGSALDIWGTEALVAAAKKGHLEVCQAVASQLPEPQRTRACASACRYAAQSIHHQRTAEWLAKEGHTVVPPLGSFQSYAPDPFPLPAPPAPAHAANQAQAPMFMFGQALFGHPALAAAPAAPALPAAPGPGVAGGAFAPNAHHWGINEGQFL